MKKIIFSIVNQVPFYEIPTRKIVTHAHHSNFQVSIYFSRSAQHRVFLEIGHDLLLPVII